jgi:hypothetical protein
MITDFIEWTTHLNQTDRVAFALVTVAVMAGVGVFIATIAELIFKALGVRTGKPDHHH